MAPREPSGQHAVGAYAQEVTPIHHVPIYTAPGHGAAQPAGELTNGNGGQAGLLKWAVERVGIPGAILGVVLWLFAGYHRDTRADRVAATVASSQQLDKVLESHSKDREIIRAALDRLTVLLERMEQRERGGRGRDRERDRRGAR